MAGQRRRGPVRPKEDSETVNLTLRISKRIYEEIRADADISGRSITAEAERRLSHREPNSGDIGRMIDRVVQAIETRSGARWSEDKDLQIQCRTAIDYTMNVLFGTNEWNTVMMKARLHVLDEINKKQHSDAPANDGFFDLLLRQHKQSSKGLDIAVEMFGEPPTIEGLS